MYPDYYGCQLTHGGFADILHSEFPEAQIVALVNGVETLPTISGYKPWLKPVLCTTVGLASTLLAGYGHILENSNINDILVRVDTNDAPLGRIEDLIGLAKIHGAVVADLSFPGRLGGYDKTVHEHKLPRVFHRATNGKLILHGNHGMQAYRCDVLQEIHSDAKMIWNEANRRYQTLFGNNSRLPWAFDASMALASYFLGNGPEVVEYNSNSVRNRPRPRVDEQLNSVSLVCEVAHQWYLEKATKKLQINSNVIG